MDSLAALEREHPDRLTTLQSPDHPTTPTFEDVNRSSPPASGNLDSSRHKASPIPGSIGSLNPNPETHSGLRPNPCESSNWVYEQERINAVTSFEDFHSDQQAELLRSEIKQLEAFIQRYEQRLGAISKYRHRLTGSDGNFTAWLGARALRYPLWKPDSDAEGEEYVFALRKSPRHTPLSRFRITEARLAKYWRQARPFSGNPQKAADRHTKAGACGKGRMKRDSVADHGVWTYRCGF